MESSLYKEYILDHYKNPRNYGEISDADIILENDNESCGDKVKIFIKLSADSPEKIENVQFTARGCAISIAAMSILTEELFGKSVGEIQKYIPKDLLEKIGMEETSGRIKCALLGLDSIKEYASKPQKSVDN